MFIYKEGYTPIITGKENQIAIKMIKDFFEKEFAKKLKLTRVSAPLMVYRSSGLNDNLSGKEKPLSFDKDDDIIEIVQSLAKWKRYALKKYNFNMHEGLYTDMNAIRPDEKVDVYHSLYVDQWDYEFIIDKNERNMYTLKNTVKKIFSVLKKLEVYCYKKFSIQPILPKNIYFITTQKLEDMYPTLSAKERENEIARKYKAVFIMQIGKKLKSKTIHDNRAPDYDDWNLNGDIIVYNPILNNALELSSMGIRVDKDSLIKQLKLSNCEDRLSFPFHQDLVNEKLPFTLGGGIGQSRLCLFFLRKLHIGEVQASVWSKQERDFYKNHKVELL